MKKKIIVLIIVVCIVGGIYVGHYVINNNVTSNIEKGNKVEQKEMLEIKANKKKPFSEGLAWVLDENNTYYVINEDGKAVFAIAEDDHNSMETVVEVEDYFNGYSVVTFRNKDNDTYEKILDREGNVVFVENVATNLMDCKYILTQVDNAGYVLVNKQGKIIAVNLKNGEEKQFYTKFSISEKEIESVGSGIFYDKYVGYISADIGSNLLLNELEIYEYNETLNEELFNNRKYEYSEFIDGNALFYNNEIYVVKNSGEVTKLDNLNGFKVWEKDSFHNKSFNGTTFCAQNTTTKEICFFDLQGNKVLDLSKYDINDVSPMVNNRVIVSLNTDVMNKYDIVVLDKEGNQLFTPITAELISGYELENDYFQLNRDIYNMHGEKVVTREQFENSRAVELAENVINVYPDDVSGNVAIYLNSELQEMKLYYTEDIKYVESNESNWPSDFNPSEEKFDYSKWLKEGTYIQIAPENNTLTDNSPKTITLADGKVTLVDPAWMNERTGTYSIKDNKLYIHYSIEKFLDDYTGNYVTRDSVVTEEYSIDETSIYKEYTSLDLQYIAGSEIYQYKK